VAGKKVPTRKVPPTITPEARQFVEHGEVAKASKRKASQVAKSTGGPRGPVGRATVERADGRTLRRIQIYFDAGVAKRLRHHCVEHDVDMSGFVNGLVEKALGK
jgi:hypothetical protein